MPFNDEATVLLRSSSTMQSVRQVFSENKFRYNSVFATLSPIIVILKAYRANASIHCQPFVYKGFRSYLWHSIIPTRPQSLRCWIGLIVIAVSFIGC